MQALIAPAIAAAGGATPLALAVQGASAIAGGVSSYAAAKSQEEQAKINSFIGRTRAIQTDVGAREGLESELGSLRAAFASNNQRPTVGTAEVFNELRRVRARDRRVELGNRMQEASAYERQASAAGGMATQGILGGFLKAAPSIFDLAEWRKRNGG